jgi:hypothetical protein
MLVTVSGYLKSFFFPTKTGRCDEARPAEVRPEIWSLMSATNLARLANYYIIPTQTLKIQKLATSLNLPKTIVT